MSKYNNVVENPEFIEDLIQRGFTFDELQLTDCDVHQLVKLVAGNKPKELTDNEFMYQNPFSY